MKITFPNFHRSRRCLSALIAVGSSLIALPAHALELGDLTIHSQLGQPLRASIAYTLAPNEQIFDTCTSLSPGRYLRGLPNINNAVIRVANGVITLTGKTPVREPMISAQILVNCPYAANIRREYMLFVDPATHVVPLPAARSAPVTATVPVVPTVAAVPVRPDVVPVPATEPEAEPEVTQAAAEPEAEPAIEFIEIHETTEDLKPGDIILDSPLPGPVTNSTSSIVQAVVSDEPSRSWMTWLAGSGIAVILTLLFFARRTRGEDTTPVAARADVEPELSDDSPTAENVLLDADLITGTGLADGSEVDLAQDFGFAATTALDIELPLEPANDATDMIATLNIDESTILKVEVLPENDDDTVEMPAKTGKSG